MSNSDHIAALILKLLSLGGGTAELQRNTLAEEIGCVPSAINYVIDSRFTTQHGYVVESRRGGGGFVRITRIDASEKLSIMHIVNSLPDALSENTVRLALENMLQANLITAPAMLLIKTATAERTLKRVAEEARPLVRADIFKRMLVVFS
jgi:transcriptional regulator CtsR